MVKHVWKELKADDMSVVTDYIATLPAEQRPLYGLVGIKTSFWSQIGGGAKPFVLLFMPDRIIMSKRSVTGSKETSHLETPLSAIRDVTVRNGPMLDSALFTFENGFSVRVGNIPHTQIEPVVRFVRDGVDAFDWNHLTDVQRTNCYYAYTMMGIVPKKLI